jgi:hypothetical protein
MAIDGHFKANGNYVFNYNPANNKVETTTVNGRFEAKNGNITKFDLIEAMRNNNTNISGNTHFNTLAGNLLLKNQSFVFSNLRLQDKQLEAYGTVSVASNGMVNGDIYSKITLKSNPIKAHLVINGNRDSLKLKK